MKKLIAAAATVTAVAITGVIAMIVAAFMLVVDAGSTPAQASCLPAGSSPAAAPPVQNDVTGKFGPWNPEQVGHAVTIVAVGKQRKVPPRGWVIALATAMQESTLHNYGNLGARNDHDSVGLFQQRPASGWGTPKELTTPHIAAGKFYHALTKVTGWQGMALTDAAQAVQRSAFPQAYAKWEDEAEALAAHIGGLKSIGEVAGGPPGAECIVKPASQDGPAAGASGWVNPVSAEVGGPFGEDRGDHMHAGVDLIAARHTPIYAAHAGTVTRIRCNSNSGTCDRDGGPNTKGCGWYAEIRGPGDTVTRYCHMVSQPRVRLGQAVTAGQLIGNVGSSGGSSGPHLHYELHLHVPKGHNATTPNAVDPVAYHKKLGVPLGRK